MKSVLTIHEERERERERKVLTIHEERERERERHTHTHSDRTGERTTHPQCTARHTDTQNAPNQ